MRVYVLIRSETLPTFVVPDAINAFILRRSVSQVLRNLRNRNRNVNMLSQKRQSEGGGPNFGGKNTEQVIGSSELPMDKRR